MAPKILVPFLYIVVITSIMLPLTNTFTLPMIPIDSPKLQILPQSATTQERHQFLKNITMSRALLHSTRRNSNFSTNSIESAVYWRFSNYYITELFFGTSSSLASPYVLLDTGDEKTWIQCDGCDPCFQLVTGNIRVDDSVTYKPLSPDDPRCIPKLVYGGKYCGFSSVYGGVASTAGLMGSDTFLFTNTQTQKPEFFPDVAFGCGLHNENFDFGGNTGPNNPIAGIFGLSPGPKSFLTQLDAVIKGRFSYCLTSWAEMDEGESTIYFGDSAQIVGPNIQQIPMHAEFRYHLYFQGISIDGKRIPIDASMCALQLEGDTKGFIIDSGAPYTVLPEPMYLIFRAALVDYFSQYGWQMIGQQVFDLCYLSGPTGSQSFPSVVFHFANGKGGEVDWVMDKDNMFVRFNRAVADGFCVVVSSRSSGPCLFGAYQHSNFRVLYDIKNSMLSFSPERCQENL